MMQIDLMEETIGEYETHAEGSTNEPYLVVDDDHIEKYQIYSNNKELQKKLCMFALKRKFQFRIVKSSTKILLVCCVDKECKWRLRASWEIMICLR